MPTNLTLTTAYAGEVLEEILLQLSTGAPSLAGGHFAVHTGIRKSKKLPRLSATNLVQAPAVIPTSQGSYTVDEQSLDPVEAMVYLRFDPRDFEDFWAPYQPGGELLFRSLPPSVQIPFLTEIMNTVNETIEPWVWTGTGTAPQPNGVITRAAANANVIDVSTPVTLTNSNVHTEFARGWAVTPEAVKINPNTKIFCSVATRELYKEMQQNQANKGIDVTQGGVMSFSGVPVVPLVGFPDDKYIITHSSTNRFGSNLHMGVDWDDSSYEVMQVEKLQADSQLYFVKMMFKMDFNIKHGAEFVAYNA